MPSAHHQVGRRCHLRIRQTLFHTNLRPVQDRWLRRLFDHRLDLNQKQTRLKKVAANF